MSQSETSKPEADVAILIVAFRSAKTLPRVAESLAAQTMTPREIFVLENGSPDLPVTEADCPYGAELVISATNHGFAGGNNLLARKAQAKWLLLLNPDAFPEPDWIEQLMAATQRHPECPLFGCTQKVADDTEGRLDGVGDVYHFTGQAYRAGYGQCIDIPEEGYVFAPCGAATLIKRDLFEGLGGFDEEYFCYCEDVDLAFRAHHAGYRPIQVSKAIVHHLGYASSGRYSEFAVYHGTRNRLWTYLKNMPGAWIWICAPFHIGLTLLLLLDAARRGQGQIILRALKDALADWPRQMEKRRMVQSRRQISAWALAKRLSWNPLHLLTRAPDICAIRTTSRPE